MTINQAINKLVRNGNKFFSVEYIKKDGTIRKLNGRLGVRTTGRGMSYNPFELGLWPVYDVQVKDFRMINTKTLISVTVKGYTYNVKEA